MPWKFFVAVEDVEGNMSTPRYLNCLTIGMLEGRGVDDKAEFKCINDDLVQLILYPDRELNKSKVDNKCGIDDPASPT